MCKSWYRKEHRIFKVKDWAYFNSLSIRKANHLWCTLSHAENLAVNCPLWVEKAWNEGTEIVGIALADRFTCQSSTGLWTGGFPLACTAGKYFVFFNMLMSFNYRRLRNRGVPFQRCTIQLHTVICTDSVRKRCSRIWPLKGTCTLSVTPQELVNI